MYLCECHFVVYLTAVNHAKLTLVRHAYTHFRVTVYAFECRYLSVGDPKAIGVNDWRWVKLAGLDIYPFPVVDRKIIAVLRSSSRQQMSFDLA